MFFPGGDHKLALPPGLREGAPAPPPFPQLDRLLNPHDGCAAQFANGTNAHQTAEERDHNRTRDFPYSAASARPSL